MIPSPLISCFDTFCSRCRFVSCGDTLPVELETSMPTASHTHWDRRRFLQVGSLGLFGLTLPQLLQLESSVRAAGKKDRPRSCIFLFLYGGPSQIDIWD